MKIGEHHNQAMLDLLAIRSHPPLATFPEWIEARSAIVSANVRLVVKISRSFHRSWHRLSLDDLVTAGNIGLLSAIDRFDPGRDCKFSTYAIHYIRGRIRREIAHNSTLIRIPVHLHPISISQKKLTDQQRERNSAVLVTGQICSGDRVHDVADDRDPEPQGTLSLLPEGVTSLSDLISERLTPREAEIVRLRFGLDGGGESERTMKVVGVILGISQQRVAQCIHVALEKLRRPSPTKPLLWPDPMPENPCPAMSTGTPPGFRRRDRNPLGDPYRELIIHALAELKTLGKPTTIQAVAQLAGVTSTTVGRRRAGLIDEGLWTDQDHRKDSHRLTSNLTRITHLDESDLALLKHLTERQPNKSASQIARLFFMETGRYLSVKTVNARKREWSKERFASESSQSRRATA